MAEAPPGPPPARCGGSAAAAAAAAGPAPGEGPRGWVWRCGPTLHPAATGGGRPVLGIFFKNDEVWGTECPVWQLPQTDGNAGQAWDVDRTCAATDCSLPNKNTRNRNWKTNCNLLCLKKRKGSFLHLFLFWTVFTLLILARKSCSVLHCHLFPPSLSPHKGRFSSRRCERWSQEQHYRLTNGWRWSCLYNRLVCPHF